MPPLPAADHVLKVAFEYGVEFQTNVNVFHVKYTGAGNVQADLDGVAANLAVAIQTMLHPLQDVDVTDRAITVTDLTSSTALSSTDAVTGNGTHGGGMTPANCAAVISWKIHRRYRGGHPRTYVGGIPITAYLDERAFTTTYVNLLIAHGLTFITDVASAGVGSFGSLVLGSLSYYEAHAVRATPVFDVITSATADARPDSQRRRLGKVAG